MSNQAAAMVIAFLRLVNAWHPVVTAINFCLCKLTVDWDCFHITTPRYSHLLNLGLACEIFRGGLQSIDNGQYESARVLRLSYWQTIRKIVIPQVIKIVLPSVGNEVINLVKDSSLVYVIGLGDLLRAGNVATARDVTLVPLVLVGIIYLALTAVTTFVLGRIEKHYSYWK